MKEIFDSFPSLTEKQKTQLSALPELYRSWNEKINVISRKDIEQITERHILHSLAIARFINFKKNTKILDIGTGGGFPGIPLAILFPNCKFHLVDSIGKKINVVKNIASSIELNNCTAEQQRAEKIKSHFHFIISRAVAPTAKLIGWTQKIIHKESFNTIPNGYILLKGGDLTDELDEIKKTQQIIEIKEYFEGSFFETKKIVYVSMHPIT